MTYNAQQFKTIRNQMDALKKRISELESKDENHQKLNQENEKSKEEIKKKPFLAVGIVYIITLIVYWIYIWLLFIVLPKIVGLHFTSDTTKAIGFTFIVVVPVIFVFLCLWILVKKKELTQAVQYEACLKLVDDLIVIFGFGAVLYVKFGLPVPSLPTAFYVVFSINGEYGLLGIPYVYLWIRFAIRYYIFKTT